MRRQRIALRLLLSISSASLLMPSADLLWAQNPPSIEQRPVPIFDIAVLHVPVSEAKIYPRRVSVGPPILETIKMQPRPQESFFTAPTSYHQLLIDNITAFKLRQLTGTAESQSSGNNLTGGTPDNSFTFEPGYLKLSNQTIIRAGDTDSDGGNIPFAGPIILRVAQQAEAHPRITRVLKILQPQF